MLLAEKYYCLERGYIGIYVFLRIRRNINNYRCGIRVKKKTDKMKSNRIRLCNQRRWSVQKQFRVNSNNVYFILIIIVGTVIRG